MSSRPITYTCHYCSNRCVKVRIGQRGTGHTSWCPTAWNNADGDPAPAAPAVDTRPRECPCGIDRRDCEYHK